MLHTCIIIELRGYIYKKKILIEIQRPVHRYFCQKLIEKHNVQFCLNFLKVQEVISTWRINFVMQMLKLFACLLFLFYLIIFGHFSMNISLIDNIFIICPDFSTSSVTFKKILFFQDSLLPASFIHSVEDSSLPLL